MGISTKASPPATRWATIAACSPRNPGNPKTSRSTANGSRPGASALGRSSQNDDISFTYAMQDTFFQAAFRALFTPKSLKFTVLA
ncbi:hypothetical protein [Cognatiluteimonas lumbrici]|uniref:hypothetical protein n=1 Tax=Cognatiluteimonas lumbrici TaxID=2559601 RepID=UPI001FEB6A0B|nr:hypothetical protein [Luteimonas lumbrici]